MPRWATPDAAIRDYWRRRGGHVQSLDLSAPRTGTLQGAQEAELAYACVAWALAQIPETERKIVVAVALGASYRSIAEYLHRSDWWVRNRHVRGWTVVRDILAELDLIPANRSA